MNTPCTKLHLFVDGELSAPDAEAFRQHLARCPECEAGLRDVLQLELLAARALGGADEVKAEAPAKVTPLRPWMQRASRALVPVALAAGLAAVGVFRFQAQPEDAFDVWLAGADSRTLEARLSYPKADRFLPYEPMRGTSGTSNPLPLRPLAELEERQDFQGIAAAYALRGDWQQAESFLSRAPASADKDNDRAVVALSGQRWEEALNLLGGALSQEPRHAQALWNRGLALRGLGLLKQAEASFRDVAALPGQEAEWRRAAERRANELRALRDAEAARRQRQVRETWARLTEGVAEPSHLVRQQPAVTRAALYEAVRTAPSAAAVSALMPLAIELDRLGGGTVLQDYVRDTAARDFAVRAPLARDYARLMKGEAMPGLLETLRASQETDLYVGALLHTGEAATDAEALKALQRYAHGSRDPWLNLLADRERARGEDAAGRAASAEQLLLATLRTCGAYNTLFPCAEIN
ncbi:zf-HC2 domain-containing protein [Myxococcus sp. Y35]|uniref:zf-HC2 domain-containing protein n=1 Tax=Pseudomyxococcus flavus TaxID=3115648 RepID=UPI003CFB6B72